MEISKHVRVAILLTQVVLLSSLSKAHAQPAELSAPIRLITTGTGGGPNPRAHRAQSSNVLIIRGTPYLIDAGDGTARRLAKAHVNFRQLGTIFITHGHDDHTSGLAALLSVQWNSQRTDPINVYGPPGTQTLVNGAIQFLSGNAEIRISERTRKVPIATVFIGHDADPGVVYQDAKVRVTAIENSHFHFAKDTSAFGRYRSYSYRFDTPDGAVVFTGDTGPSEAVTQFARGADLLVSEVASYLEIIEQQKRDGRWDRMTPQQQEGVLEHLRDEHLTPENVGRMATAAGVKSVVLSHLTPRPGTDDYTPWADEVKKHFSGSVSIAKDLMEFPVVRR